MSKDNDKKKEPGGDKVISGARTMGQVCEKLCGYCLTTFTLIFLGGLVSNGVADAKIGYNKRKMRKEGNHGN